MSMNQSHQSVVPVTVVDDADIHAWKKGEDITLRQIRAIQTARGRTIPKVHDGLLKP